MVKGQKYHMLYKTTCTVNGKYYIGIHSTFYLNDGYLGSGKRLHNSIKYHGVENFIREILELFDSREDLIRREKEIITEELLKDPMCMNLKPGGNGGFANEEHERKYREGTERVRKDCLSTGHKTQALLWKTDIEWGNKIKEARHKFLKGNTFFLNKTHTIETRSKIGKANSISQKGEKNSQFGSMWITNGKENKKIKKTDIIPDGWNKGRK